MWDVDIEISAGPVRPVSTSVFDVTTQLVSQPCFLYGWSIRESSGAATVALELRSGDTVVGELEAPQSGTTTQWFGPHGIYCRGGLQRVTVAGQWTGTVYVAYARAHPGYSQS